MMEPKVRIRDLHAEDYDELVGLWQRARLIHKPHGRDTREKIGSELTEKTSVFRVAIEGDRLIGAVFGTHDGRKGWINRLVVDPVYQQRGIATKLLRDVERLLNDLGIEIIACLIDEDNPGSMEFFRKSGYIEHRDIIYFAKKKHPEV